MSSLCRRLHGIFSKPVIHKVENVIIKTTPAPKPPTQPTTTTTPASLSSIESKLQKEVEQFKRSSDSRRFRNSYRKYDNIVRRLAYANQFSLIEDLLERQKKYEDIANEHFTVRLITLYGKWGMFDHALKVFDEMPDLNCERTVLSFNTLLAASVNSKEFDKLLRELPEKLSVEPNMVTYNTFIKALCETEALDMALTVLDGMEEDGWEPDVISFNTFLEEFDRNGRFSDGEKMWEMMKSKNVDPSIRSYNSKQRGLVGEERLSEAVELFDELMTKGLKPDGFSYNALIKGFCSDGNLKEAKKWYRELLKCKCVPDKVTVWTLIPFLCKNGDSSMALEICKEIIRRRFVVEAALFQLVVDGQRVQDGRSNGACGAGKVK